jgi:hypothetical protein
MFEIITDLLPDETGEFIGCGLFLGGAYLMLEHQEQNLKQEKIKAEELKSRIQELSVQIEKTCLSPEAMEFIKKQSLE